MAEFDFTSRFAKLPYANRGETRIDRFGYTEYDVDTHFGVVTVFEGPVARYIRGNVDSIESLGLVQRSWLPGADGNNKTRQRVAFHPAGALLLFGKQTTTCPFPWILIERRTTRQLGISHHYFPQEIEAMRERQATLSKKRDEDQREAALADVRQFMLECTPKTSADWKAEMLRDVESLLNRLSNDDFAYHMAYRFKFSDASHRKIMAKLDALKQDILGAAIVPRAPAVEGNVIHLVPAFR